jgi:hypothetical protein
VNRLLGRAFALGCLGAATLSAATLAAAKTSTVWILTRDGQSVEGQLAASSLTVSVDGKSRTIPVSDLLSVNLGDAASSAEAGKITSGLTAVAGMDRKARETAAEELTNIGLPALTPLLDTYKDTDAHEPNPLGHLFPRLISSQADALERTLDVIRLADGTSLRGDVAAADLHVTVEGKDQTIPVSAIRRLAVRRKSVERAVELQSLRHCTQIEFMDTGVAVTPASRLEEQASGFVRLAFNVDGWTSDPDGLKKPGPNYKTNLVDGFPFGAVVGKVGATGPRWFAGKHLEKSGLGTGRLYLAINDNGHWQNNLGSFRVKLRVTDAYDLGDPS